MTLSVDLMLRAAEKITLVLEASATTRFGIHSSSLNHPLTILPDQGIEIVGIQKKVNGGAGDPLGLLAEP